MNKLRLLLAGGCALAMFFAFSGTASAIHDPLCDQYNNEFGVYDFDIETPDSQKEYDVSGVVGSGLACGSEISFPNVGGGSLYNHAQVFVAPGVEIADTDGQEGNFAGTATVNILYFLLGVPVFQENVASNMRANVGGKAECEQENNDLVGGPHEGIVVACYYAWNWIGWNWNWAMYDPETDRYTLTIGPMYPIIDIDSPGLTYIEMELCAYFGESGACGGPGDQWVQKNGDGSILNCPGGRGIYTVTATNNDGEETPVTPESTDCVKWSSTSRQSLGRALKRGPKPRATRR